MALDSENTLRESRCRSCSLRGAHLFHALGGLRSLLDVHRAEDGIRQFVVGTGGRSHYQISQPIANTEVYSDETFGVLELTLHPRRYDWEFVPVKGETFSDSSVARCH